MSSADLHDVWPNYNGPSHDTRLMIEYHDSGAFAHNFDALTPTMVAQKPVIHIKTGSNCQFLTCVLVDPDAPSRAQPKNREWLHYIVANLRNSPTSPKMDVTNSDQGEELVGYVGAGPPKGTGLHRYMFLVFAHDEPLVLHAPDKNIPSSRATGRAKFSVHSFAQKYHLGEPLAIDGFQAEYDDYVPKLYETLVD